MRVYILSAVRTAIGKFGGYFKDINPPELGGIVIQEALKRSGIPSSSVDLVIMGNVLRAGHGQDLARQALLKANLPVTVDGYCIDMVCSSGMMSIINGGQMIKSGDAEVVVVGGMESMSRAAFSISADARWGVKSALHKEFKLTDTMLYDGLTDPANYKLMGQEADMIAKERDVKREELDNVAFESHMRAYKATASGNFKSEVVPVTTSNGEVYQDEGIRKDTSLEKLSKLRPAFGENGLHTAGNSSQISDGASALVLAGESAITKFGVEPIAELKGISWIGTEGWRFPEAPVYAIKKLLSKIGKTVNDIDYFENNEAFAVASVLVHKLLGIPYERLNLFGGAIALGHPIGASGARIVTTLINVLTKNNAEKGIASLCHGTGGATAIYIEKVRGLK